MTALEQLNDFAFDQDYTVFSKRIDSIEKGCCLTNSTVSVILINRTAIADSADEICVLAEEMGHLQTGAVLPVEDYIDPGHKKWTKAKNELRAERWAITKLLPPEKIQAAINYGCINNWEIAEYYDVTVSFVEKAFEFYRKKRIEFVYSI